MAGVALAQRRERREAFDLQHGTDTGRQITIESLLSRGADVPALWRYWPTSFAVFSEIMAALPLPHEELVFVDLGSGKGRALLYASQWPFRHIVGVELSPALHRIAERNVSLYRSPQQRCHSFELVCMDAASFTPPPGPTVLYLFQPFPAETFTAVLRNVLDGLARHPRPLAIAYLNPLFDEMLLDTGRFARHRLVRARHPGEFDWAVYRNRA
jgi:hypothetical protein